MDGPPQDEEADGQQEDNVEVVRSPFKPPPPRDPLHFSFAPIRKNARFASATLSSRSGTAPREAKVGKERPATAPDPMSPVSPPRSFGAHSKAETSKSKTDVERAAVAKAIKEERLKREEQMLERQQKWSKNVQDAASKARADAAAANAEKEKRELERRRESENVRQKGIELRKQRADQRARYQRAGHKVQELCVETRAAVKSAFEKLSEDNLTKAKAWTKERLAKASQVSESKAALESAKKASVKQRRVAESTAGRDALALVMSERAELAAAIRSRLERDTRRQREELKTELMTPEPKAEDALEESSTSFMTSSQLARKKRHEQSTFARAARQTQDKEAHTIRAAASKYSFLHLAPRAERTTDLEAATARMKATEEKIKTATEIAERREADIASRRAMRDAVVQEQFKVPTTLLIKRRQADRGGSSDETYPLEASADLRVESQKMLARVKELEDRAANVMTATFARRLGAAVTSGKRLDEMVREWEKAGDTIVNSLKFVQIVRNSLGVKGTQAEIEALFADMDDDGSGELDLSELKVALKALKSEASGAVAEGVALRAQVDAIQQKVARLVEVADTFAQFEAADTRLNELQAILKDLSASVEQRNKAGGRRKQFMDERLALRKVAVKEQRQLTDEREVWAAEAKAEAKAAAKAKAEALAAAKKKKEMEEAKKRATATFPARLGLAVIAQTTGKPLEELLLDWDRSGDGVISKMEFRWIVRTGLDVQATNAEIDSYFASMDADAGGALDTSELQTALQVLVDASVAADVGIVLEVGKQSRKGSPGALAGSPTASPATTSRPSRPGADYHA